MWFIWFTDFSPCVFFFLLVRSVGWSISSMPNMVQRTRALHRFECVRFILIRANRFDECTRNFVYILSGVRLIAYHSRHLPHRPPCIRTANMPPCTGVRSPFKSPGSPREIHKLSNFLCRYFFYFFFCCGCSSIPSEITFKIFNIRGKDFPELQFTTTLPADLCDSVFFSLSFFKLIKIWSKEGKSTIERWLDIGSHFVCTSSSCSIRCYGIGEAVTTCEHWKWLSTTSHAFGE